VKALREVVEALVKSSRMANAKVAYKTSAKGEKSANPPSERQPPAPV
jgi:hypothetical protein